MPGTIVDPGAGLGHNLPTNRTEVSFGDPYGDEAKSEAGVSRSATTTQCITLMQTTANLSQAGVLNARISIRLAVTGPATASGPNDGVSSKATFVFQDPATRLVAKYQIPSPSPTIFLDDNITVDRANNDDVTAYLQAMSAIGQYSNGASIAASTQLIRAYRWQRRGGLVRSSRFRE